MLITHYMEEASQADKVFIMIDDVITDEGILREVFSHQDKLMKRACCRCWQRRSNCEPKEEGIDLGVCPVTLHELVGLIMPVEL